MKTLLKTLGLSALLSLAPMKKILAQDPVQVKGNPALEWFADGVANKNGKAEALEVDYMKMKFEKSDILYVCTHTPSSFYNSRMKKLHTSLAEAHRYWTENPLISPQTIVAFNKDGQIVGAYDVASRLKDFKTKKIFELPNINYKKEMLERLEKAYPFNPQISNQ